jgi:hypothetical protein
VDGFSANNPALAITSKRAKSLGKIETFLVILMKNTKKIDSSYQGK